MGTTIRRFRWFPRICKKIKGIDRDQTPKEKSLKRFHQLDMENRQNMFFG